MNIKIKLLIIFLLNLQFILSGQELIYRFAVEDIVNPNELKAAKFDQNKTIIFTPNKIWIQDFVSNIENVIIVSDSYFNTYDYYNDTIVFGEYQADIIIPYKLDLVDKKKEILNFNINDKLIKEIRITRNHDQYLFRYWDYFENLDKLVIIDLKSKDMLYSIENLNIKSYRGYYPYTDELLIMEKINNRPHTYFETWKDFTFKRETISFYRHYVIGEDIFLLKHNTGKYMVKSGDETSKKFDMNGVLIINISNSIENDIFVYHFSDKAIYKFKNIAELKKWCIENP